jgi:DNA-directed RNA polymerase alpha subunit
LTFIGDGTAICDREEISVKYSKKIYGSVDTLDVGVRAYNVMKNQGIERIVDLPLSYDKLRKMFGTRDAERLVRVLEPIWSPVKSRSRRSA